MAEHHKRNRPSRFFKPNSILAEKQLSIHGIPFCVNLDLLAAKSSKIAELLEADRSEDIPCFLRQIHADAETFEVVIRFCHGFPPNLTPNNIVGVICLAYHLGMDDKRSTNNLLDQAILFLEERVIPSWNESIIALRASGEHFLQQAEDLGVISLFVGSIAQKASSDPRILGDPIGNCLEDLNDQSDSCDEREIGHWPHARRRLFVLDCKSEDLITLPLHLYEPIIQAMNKHDVPDEYLAASVLNYAKRWIFDSTEEKNNHHRDIIQAIDRLLPHQRGLIPCSFLFGLLQQSVLLDASLKTRDGFETRIGTQLDQATVKDLLIPFIGCSKEDIDCVRRILKVFYTSCKERDVSGFLKVTKLMEEFLAEAAANDDLNIGAFVSLAQLAIAASQGVQQCADRIYRAVDIYLAKHGTLTECEKMEVCKVLDCHKLSPEACDHAATNHRLPLRITVQVLFVSQLQLRDSIMKEVQEEERMRRERTENGDEEDEEQGKGRDNFRLHKDETMDEDGYALIEKRRTTMRNQSENFENECGLEKREIENGCAVHRRGMKPKVSIWREVKRKLGCMTGIHECNCQVKKKKKKNHPWSLH